MRHDMKELLVEVSRVGGNDKGQSRKNNWKRGFDADDEFFDGGTNRHQMPGRNYNRKSQGDNLGPLRGFLHSRVGQKWDRVFSEICAVNDKRSMLGFHLLTHLAEYVRAPGLNRTSSIFSRYFDFVVDASGILRESPKDNWRARDAERRRLERRKQLIEEIPGTEGWTYKKIDGLWYRVKTDIFFVPYSEEYLAEENGEVVIRRTPQRMIEQRQERKVQVGKKELRGIRECLKEECAKAQTAISL